MLNLEAWVRGWLNKSALPAAQPASAPTLSPPPAPVSALDQRIDAAIAAAETSIAHSELLASFAVDNNAFAVALYHTLRGRDGNQFFSPFSIRSALMMAYAGARGETAAEMREALCMSMSDEALHEGNGELVRALGAGKGTVAVANSLWGQIGAPLEAAFVERIANNYSGYVKSVDFRREPESARTMMNQSVSEQTNGRISNLLPPGSILSDARLVLLNAVYFKALWATAFDRELTRDEPFFLEDGRELQAPLMHQIETAGYHQGLEYQAIRLSYRHTDLAMLVLLPDRRDGLKELETTLSAAMIKECLQAIRACEVDLFLPRFKVTWGTVELKESLAALGMRLPFTRAADFSGINGLTPPDQESLFVSSVLHKAFVDVNEEGTEAAAATAVTVFCTGPPSPPPPTPVFRADHPFLFAICDRKSGSIVFLGRVVDPTRED
jgi:serine protease inhibitor